MTRSVRAWRLGGGAALLAVTVSANALARHSKNSDACFKAPVDGQKLQRAGKLLEARARFAQCASSSCPHVVSKACTRWLAGVKAAVPSIRLEARDDQHHELTGVTASVDGQAALPLSSSSIDVDPGKHDVVFHRDGSPDVVQHIVVAKGDKNVNVIATFALPAKPSTTPAVVAPTSPAETQPEPASQAASRPVPLAVWILGGVGAAGLLSFGTFGTLGLVQRGGSDCSNNARPDVFDSCQNGSQTKFRVADISLGVGVVALGAATWLYLKRPSARGDKTSLSVGVRPLAGGAAAAVGATF